MNGLRRHPVRVIGRLVWFGLEVIQAVVVFFLRCVFCPRASRRSARARWLQRTGRRVGRIFRLEIEVSGKIPERGMLICNHVSYVDILALVTLAPAMFVAKREVRSWPVMGFLAQLGGTLFIDRQRRTHVGEINGGIEQALADGALVIVFPEGTSSDGRSVLPFKSSLLESAAQPTHPLTVARMRYVQAGGEIDDAVAYWGEDVFFPHLLNLLGRERVNAAVSFAPVSQPGCDRKELARQLHAAVLALKH